MIASGKRKYKTGKVEEKINHSILYRYSWYDLAALQELVQIH